MWKYESCIYFVTHTYMYFPWEFTVTNKTSDWCKLWLLVSIRKAIDVRHPTDTVALLCYLLW